MNDESERQLFLEAIEASPEDRIIRMIFADWLDEHGEHDEATLQRSWKSEKQSSEEWIAEFARNHDMTVADVIGAANHFLDTGNTSYNGVDITNMLFVHQRDYSSNEFWSRFTIVTGRSIDGATGDVYWRMDLANHPGDEGDPCGMCPWESDGYEAPEPFDDEFYNEKGW